ncbi:papain cysteine protease family protein [Rhizoctonia solani 123E]|uniref:Papain cysteine protease family protein n=1 Tax=Rhizoctonia solani 123E TaxID=1423351 RepID=A0A074S9B8_9AGAM|nr:papain cysteine protease family protein [Rhizoctonia solani 123E]
MSFFNTLADATEDSSKLGAQAIDVAQRTHNGLLDAAGVGKALPNPVKHLTDGVFDTSENVVLDTGDKTAGMLRTVGKNLGNGQGNSDNLPEHENNENMNNMYTGSGGDDGEDNGDDGEEGGDDDEEGGPPAGAPPQHHGPVPDQHDSRDHPYKFDPHHSLGQVVDLRRNDLPAYDQGQMKSCTANAVAAAFEFSAMKENLPQFSPSRLFIWYNSRAKSQNREDVKKNVGTSVRIAIQSVFPKASGVCSEEDWSYQVGKYNKKTMYFVPKAKAAQKPPVSAMKHAHQHTAVSYRRFSTNNQDHLCEQLMQCLDKGVPWVFGMNHCDVLHHPSMKTNGWVANKPSAAQLKDNTNRHSLMAVGYIKDKKLFIIRNSWGENWGDNGHFYMPFNLLYLCYDFWSIKAVVPK